MEIRPVSLRRRAQLERARLDPLPPPGAPDPALPADVRQAWRDIAAACPEVLRDVDALIVEACARRLASWRRGLDYGTREIYRAFGGLFMPMRDRRRLLFPDRPPRRELA